MMGENYRNSFKQKKILKNLLKALSIFGTAPAWTELGPTQPQLVLFFLLFRYPQSRILINSNPPIHFFLFMRMGFGPLLFSKVCEVDENKLWLYKAKYCPMSIW